MFEKDAEEFVDSKKSFWRQGRTCIDSVRQAFQKGAEFGYKLAHEEMDYLNKHWRSEEARKANEWHYPSKGELPGESEEEIKEKGEKVYAIFKNNSYYIIDRVSVKNYEDLIAWTELPTFTKA